MRGALGLAFAVLVLGALVAGSASASFHTAGISIEADRTIAEVRPRAAEEIALTVRNLGAQAVRVDLAVSASPALLAYLPASVGLDARGSAGAARSVALVVTGASGPGWVNEVGTIDVAASSDRGDATTFSVLVVTRGLDTPAGGWVAAAGALAAAGLLRRRR